QRFLNSPAPEMDFVIPDILPARIVSVLAAPGGDGKGLLGIQAGITISSGLPFLGLPETATEPQKVMFISAEDNTDELHRRYLDIATSLSVTREIDDQIHDQARN